MTKLAKTIKTIIISILLFLIFFYTILFAIVKRKAIKISEFDLSSVQNIVLNSTQNELVWFVFTGNKNISFRWEPFIFDLLQSNNSNQLAFITAFNCVKRNNYKTTLDWRLAIYGTKRYIVNNTDPVLCIKYLTSNAYMGKGIYGINKAALNYYKKNVRDLSDKEFISLILLLKSPALYNIDSEMNNIETNRIYNDYY